MPATNASLATVAAAGGYTFTGPTTITFGTAPGKITVTNLPTYNNTQMAYPSNGVIYVKASGSCPLYSALYPSYSPDSSSPSTQRLGLRRRDDQRDLRHRPDDRDPERPRRHGRRQARPGRGRHARPHRRRLRPRRARHQRLRPLDAAQRPHLQQHGHRRPAHRRGDPDPAALGHRRPLLLRRPDRQADDQRHDRAEVPRRRRQEQRRLGASTASSRTTRTTRGSPSARRRTSSIP